MMIISSCISTISSIVGLYFSYVYNLPSGAMIVLCAFFIYILVFIGSKLNFFKGKEQLYEKIISIALIFLLFLAACGNGKSGTSSNEKLKIVTTNSILYDMVKNTASKDVEIHSIVPVGQDPHEYEVKPKDIKALTDADVVFYNGLNLETGNGWFKKHFHKLINH